MTKHDKTEQLAEITEQLEDFYTQDEAAALINRILEPWSPLCRLSFTEGGFKISYSYMVKSWHDRHLICAILANTGATARSCESLEAEWRFHNIAYDMHIRRRSARDVDLDYERDPRRIVRAVTALFDWLDIE